MGQLPEVRVRPSKPFTNTGVDYSGPFYIKQGSKRSKTLNKCYVALFVCLSTKAIHLELVTELSTDAYIASLRRFVARRGLCRKIYSDNGTNFVGAERELRKIIFERKLQILLHIKVFPFTLFPLVLLTWVASGKQT